MTEGEKEWRLDSTSDEQRDGNEREREDTRCREIRGIEGSKGSEEWVLFSRGIPLYSMMWYYYHNLPAVDLFDHVG